jgi:hypothetical protein
VRSTTVLFATAMTALTTVAAAACDGGCRAADWCTDVNRRADAFDTDRALDPEALAEFAKVGESAPAPVRDDIRLLHRDLVLLLRSDPEFVQDAARIERMGAAIDRLDDYLREECGVEIPARDGAS